MDAVSGKDFRYGVFFCVKISPLKRTGAPLYSRAPDSSALKRLFGSLSHQFAEHCLIVSQRCLSGVAGRAGVSRSGLAKERKILFSEFLKALR